MTTTFICTRCERELSIDVREGTICGECVEAAERDDTSVDDDPRCVCGTHRSEHALCGCGEWETAR